MLKVAFRGPVRGAFFLAGRRQDKASGIRKQSGFGVAVAHLELDALQTDPR